MKREWRIFFLKVSLFVGLALFVHGAMRIFLGAAIAYVVPGILVAGAIYIALFDRTPLPAGAFLKRGVALLLAAFAVWLAVPETSAAGIQWQPFSNQLLDAARRGGRPVMIEFTIAGCAPCLEMERKVFHRPAVVSASEPFLPLKATLTNADAETAAVAHRFNIDAFPTVVFVGTNGEERVNLRLIGYEPAEFFVQRLEAAR